MGGDRVKGSMERASEWVVGWGEGEASERKNDTTVLKGKENKG